MSDEHLIRTQQQLIDAYQTIVVTQGQQLGVYRASIAKVVQENAELRKELDALRKRVAVPEEQGMQA